MDFNCPELGFLKCSKIDDMNRMSDKQESKIPTEDESK